MWRGDTRARRVTLDLAELRFCYSHAVQLHSRPFLLYSNTSA